MKNSFRFDQLMDNLKNVAKSLPDKRIGNNIKYNMEDFVLSAFSVFFTQSPSFLDYQNSMRKLKGHDNAESLFQIKDIPTDNHIRNNLDHINPELFFPIYKTVFKIFQETKILDSYRSFKNNLLIPLDGTWYYSSKSINCDKCQHIKHKDGSTTYYHSAITPVIVTPDNGKVISLPPEFITPQDGHSKQDCENAAAKRWILNNHSTYAPLGTTILGDDLYCRHPICSLLNKNGFSYILTCKPDSHKTLYEYLDAFELDKDIFTVTKKIWTGTSYEFHTYRWANHLPLRDSEDTVWVNWCELTIQDASNKIIFKNSYATNFKISDKNIDQIVADGRARFKIENENNNILKTKGYNLEHNFGHGKINLSMVFMTLNILAFLFHTVLEYCDDNYRILRRKLKARRTFFSDIRALTRYFYFESWDFMLNFMLEGLKRKHRF
jgi:hypothetical protein